MLSKIYILTLLYLFSIGYINSQVILFDDCHGQLAGNACWSPKCGYRTWSELLKNRSFIVKVLSDISGTAKFNENILKDVEILILPEPNIPYTQKEKKIIVNFLLRGGKIIAIANHGGSDRNFDNYDSSKIFNEMFSQFGVRCNGDVIFEAPLRGKIYNHPISYGIRSLGIWGGTSFSISNPDLKVIAKTGDGRAVILAGEIGKGKIVMIGDSTIFEDGNRIGRKNLHRTYFNFLYQLPQLSINIVNWLTGREEELILEFEPKFAEDAKYKERDKNIFIDCSHYNNEAYHLYSFSKDLKIEGFNCYYNFEQISLDLLRKCKIFIVSNPQFNFKKREIEALKKWIRDGGILILSGMTDRHQACNSNAINKLLSGIGSQVRINSDQVQDDTNNSQRPWGILIHNFGKNWRFPSVKQIMLWSSASIVDSNYRPILELSKYKKLEVIELGDNDTYQVDADKKANMVRYPKGSRIVLATWEKLNKGQLVLLGMCHFTDFQYPQSKIYPVIFKKIKHQTPLFNKLLIKKLIGIANENL